MRRDTPLTRSGVPAPINTAYGYISHSEAQTEWTLTILRRNVPAAKDLSDDDIVWLLARGWQP